MVFFGMGTLSNWQTTIPSYTISSTINFLIIMRNDFLMLSEITVSYKPTFQISECPQISQSSHSEHIFRKYWPPDINLYERSFLLLLNHSNKVLGIIEIGLGGIDRCVIDVYKILQIALACNATGIIIAHNHPGGTLRPSPADSSITENLDKAAQLMRIRLLDHIILTEHGYYSFADDGLL